jgi:type VI secretion system secreted protein Hcp
MPIYMQYDGIKGDVTAEGHGGWIELGSCQFGVSRGVSSPTGRGANREASAPAVSEIVVTKTLECSSMLLFQESVKGIGKKVKIDFCKTDKDKLESYLVVELDNVLVSSYSVSSGGDRPMESLALNFTKINLTTTFQDDKNTAGKPSRAEYDLAKAVGK